MEKVGERNKREKSRASESAPHRRRELREKA
jgi:hypothetical protein